jgi:hypothetical protein
MRDAFSLRFHPLMQTNDASNMKDSALLWRGAILRLVQGSAAAVGQWDAVELHMPKDTGNARIFTN